MGKSRSNNLVFVIYFVILWITTSASGEASHYWSFDKSQSISSIRDERGENTLAVVTGDGASFNTISSASTLNNYLTLSQDASLNLGSFSDCSGSLAKCSDGFTLSLLVRLHKDVLSETIIQAISDQQISWSLTREQNILNFTVSYDSYLASVLMKFRAKRWNHFSFVFKRKVLKAYMNGEFITESLVERPQIDYSSVSSSNIILGALGSKIHADFDMIGIWHKPLAYADIQSYYENILERIILSDKCDATSSSLCLKWNNRDDIYDLIGSTYIEYSDQNIDEIITNRTSIENKQNIHCIKGLDAETTYELHIVTLMIDGQQRKSNSIVCTTKDGIPAPPILQDVRIVNSTSIVIKWERPNPTLGTILNYRLELSVLQKDTGAYVIVKTIPLPGTLKGGTVVLKNTKELSKYRVSMKSIGKVGAGKSVNYEISTFRKVDELEEVSEIYVSETNDREIALQWKPLVAIHEAPQLKYKIRYRKYREPYRTLTVLASNITLRNLEEKTVYLINLQPVTKNEEGPWKERDFIVKTKDRNECSQPMENLCDALATCVNTLYGYECTCPIGYHGNGRVCRRTPAHVNNAHYCHNDDSRGIKWPKVYSGDRIVVNCPPGSEGFAVRHCKKASLHSHAMFARGDLSGCVSREITDLEVFFLDQIGYELEAIQMLENVTRTIPLYGGDISRTLEYTSLVANRIFSSQHTNTTKKIIEGITSIASNLLDSSAINAWFDIPKDKRKVLAENLVNSVEDLAKKYQNVTNNEFESNRPNLAIKATTLENGNFSRKNLNKTDGYSIQLPIDELKSKGASNVIYSIIDNVGEYLGQPNNGLSVSKSIISASIVNFNSIKFQDEAVVIKIPHPKKSIVTSQSCVYWDVKKSVWSSEGCVVNSTTDDVTTCHCNHLTNFAVLMSVTPEGTDILVNSVHAFSLRIITIICLTISIVVMVIALFTFICFRFLRSARTSYHRNLVLSLLFASIIFLGGIHQTQNPVTCRVVAALLEYFYLVSFIWMAIEGILLYYMLRKVFKDQKLFQRKLFQASCWLVPAVWVGIFAILYPQHYGTPGYCWLSYEDGFIWSFVAPVLLIILFNVIVVGLAFQIMAERSKDSESDFKRQVWYWMKGCFVLLFILGVTWIFGLLHVSNNSIAMAYIFSILNALQGLFIFIFHCLIDPKIRQEYLRILKCQSRSEYNEVNGYSTSMRFRKLSTSMTNSTTIERKPKLLTSNSGGSFKVEENGINKESFSNDSFSSHEDKKPLLHDTSSPTLSTPNTSASFQFHQTPSPSPPPQPSPTPPPPQPPEPQEPKNRESNFNDSIVDIDDSFEDITDQTFSGRSDDEESIDTIKEMSSFVRERPKSDFLVNTFDEERILDPPALTSEKKKVPRESMLCEEVFNNEVHAEPWRLSMFDRLDEEETKQQNDELEQFSQYQYERPKDVVNQYDSNENIMAPPPKREIDEEIFENITDSSNVESENTLSFDNDMEAALLPEQNKHQPSDKIKNEDLDEPNRMSIPSKIINEIGDVMVEIPVAAQSPPPKPRRRIRSRRRLDDEKLLDDESDFSPVRSLSLSSMTSSMSSGISSPAFDHESLFKTVDDEIENDYRTIERKKGGKEKRPRTPTYRAQMEIIQLKPGTALISPQRDVVVDTNGDENGAFEY